MFNVTPQEKLILIFVGLVSLCGVTLSYYQKHSSIQTSKIDKFIQEKILKDKILNINTATKDELVKLPGIGEKIAQGIIEYRQSHGNFTSIDGLKNIKGISNNKLEKIKGCLTVE